MKTLSIETSVYNEKRYSKPWIALVDFSENKQGNFKFGDWIGEYGYSGLLELNVEIGDIVARGQKDYRKPRNSAPDFYIVDENYELTPVSKVDAYKHFKTKENTL